MATPTPFAVNPEEAIAYFRQKLNLPTKTWTDLWEGMHARAFVVAGATSEALLADFRNAVDKALAEGKSLGWFRDEFDRIVEAHGWSYNGSPGWRSAVILNTNLRMAYAAGRWAQVVRLADRRPFLRYVAVMDTRTRPLHREWHDTVLRWDHPWWQTHFPPNGWNCRCTIQQLSERDLTRLGLRVSPEPPPSPLVARPVSSGAGHTYIMTPKGIDPGFAYNPGEAGFGRGAEQVALERHGKWTALEPPFAGPRPAPIVAEAPAVKTADAIQPGDTAAIRALVAKAIGGDEAIFVDPTGERILLSQAIADHWLASAARQDGRERYFPLMPDLITNPAEIWVGWARSSASGRVALRRRYIKLVRFGKDMVLGVVADADGHQWAGVTFFRGSDVSAVNSLRGGVLVWKREG